MSRLLTTHYRRHSGIPPGRGSLPPKNGFTLIEVIVTVVVLSIITLLTAVAFPEVRTNQALIQSERQIQSLLRIAQQQALDEVRAPDCLNQAGGNVEAEKRCSDIGVAFKENIAVTFADTSDDDEYSESQDFEIAEVKLSAPVTGGDNWQSFLFEATPPDVALFANSTQLLGDTPSRIGISVGDASRTLLIYPYGQVERSSE